jgi:hypothetical protein
MASVACSRATSPAERPGVACRGTLTHRICSLAGNLGRVEYHSLTTERVAPIVRRAWTTPSPLPRAEGAQCSEDNQGPDSLEPIHGGPTLGEHVTWAAEACPGGSVCTVRPFGFAQFGCTVRTTDTDAEWLPCRALGAGLSKPEQMGVGVPLP